MNQQGDAGISRRRAISLLAAMGVAGCLGGDQEPADGSDGGDGGDDENGGSDATRTPSPSDCGAAYGDTYERYDPDEREMLTTFEYPTGGELVNEESNQHGHSTSWRYENAQQLLVTERGPRDEPADVGAVRIEEDSWETAGTVTFDGSERTVAAKRTEDFSVIYLWGFDGPDGTYEIEVQASVVTGDECPEAYEAVCRRVSDSFELR